MSLNGFRLEGLSEVILRAFGVRNSIYSEHTDLSKGKTLLSDVVTSYQRNRPLPNRINLCLQRAKEFDVGIEILRDLLNVRKLALMVGPCRYVSHGWAVPGPGIPVTTLARFQNLISPGLGSALGAQRKSPNPAVSIWPSQLPSIAS